MLPDRPHLVAMDIIKSTRHSKIAGTFGESLLLYWLSKHGFECATVDHTGIDLIARNPHSQEVMGISVKSRTRTSGTDDVAVSIASDQFGKAQRACDAFGCTPYFAIVVDAVPLIRIFLISMTHLLEIFPCGMRVCSWKMTRSSIAGYYADPAIKIVEFSASTHSWWTTPA